MENNLSHPVQPPHVGRAFVGFLSSTTAVTTVMLLLASL
jgi:hypothetical protein